MLIQISLLLERRRTLVAFKQFLFGVRGQMVLQIAVVFERSIAYATLVRSILVVCLLMDTEAGSMIK